MRAGCFYNVWHTYSFSDVTRLLFDLSIPGANDFIIRNFGTYTLKLHTVHVAALILKNIKKIIESTYNIIVTDAVLSVPSFCDTPSTYIMELALRMAGFDKYIVIPTMLAAAMFIDYPIPGADIDAPPQQQQQQQPETAAEPPNKFIVIMDVGEYNTEIGKFRIGPPNNHIQSDSYRSIMNLGMNIIKEQLLHSLTIILQVPNMVIDMIHLTKKVDEILTNYPKSTTLTVYYLNDGPPPVHNKVLTMTAEKIDRALESIYTKIREAYQDIDNKQISRIYALGPCISKFPPIAHDFKMHFQQTTIDMDLHHAAVVFGALRCSTFRFKNTMMSEQRIRMYREVCEQGAFTLFFIEHISSMMYNDRRTYLPVFLSEVDFYFKSLVQDPIFQIPILTKKKNQCMDYITLLKRQAEEDQHVDLIGMRQTLTALRNAYVVLRDKALMLDQRRQYENLYG